MTVPSIWWLAVAGAPDEAFREPEQAVLSHHCHNSLGAAMWVAGSGVHGPAGQRHGGRRLWYLVPAGCLLSGSPLVGAALWGSYACARLVVVDVVAARMLRRGCRVGGLTDRLVLRRWRIQPAMSMLAVVDGAIVALVLGR